MVSTSFSWVRESSDISRQHQAWAIERRYLEGISDGLSFDRIEADAPYIEEAFPTGDKIDGLPIR